MMLLVDPNGDPTLEGLFLSGTSLLAWVAIAMIAIALIALGLRWFSRYMGKHHPGPESQRPRNHGEESS